MLREPAVAGYFYAALPERLREEVRDFVNLEPTPKKVSAFGIVSPHAGYMYSGGVAGAVFSQVEIPQKNIILCPNHTGMGSPASINLEGGWKTPLGVAPIDSELAQKLKDLAPWLDNDSEAHAREHALEVQIPFLQVLRPDFEFVPLCLSHFRYADCEAMGEALAKLIQSSKEKILMVASSDMNHYESQERTLAKDNRAIDRILALDPEGLYARVHEESISMCGIIPTTCMLIAAKRLGAKQATLIKHATSGDITGDFSGVVGYAGIIIE